ncbi:hypothetical protein BKA80DRAFT_213218 [Phyllosticta citrichinensis]
MSGIEVAGLVLGAVPLIIEAMKQYADGARTVKRFIFYEEPLRDLSRNLRAERAICQNTCEKLLQGIAPESEIDGLLQDMDGKLWERLDLEPAVRLRLGRSHEPFVETLIRMGEVIREIANKLKLDQKYHANRTKKFRKEYERLQFTLKKSSYDELMKTVCRYNKRLNQLADQSSRHEQGLNGHSVRCKLPDFRNFQRYASAIHALIQRCFNCTCSNFHTASLRLDRPREDRDINTPGGFRFGLLFSYTAEPTLLRPTAPWNVEAAEIGLLEQEESKLETPPPVALKGKGRISFLAPEPRASPTPPTQMAPMQQISDLCNALNEFKQSHQKICVGYMLDEHEGKRKYGLFLPRSTAMQQKPHSFVSLRDVLANGHAASGFNLRAKVNLAVAVANSMIGLHDTPWLDSFWGENDIVFLKCADKPEFDSPYIWKKNAHVSSNGDANPAWTPYSPRNKALYSLGILLTEIYLGTSFEQVLEQNLRNGDISEALERIIDQVSDAAGDECGDAVRRCIFCLFDCRRIDFEGEDFCRMFYTQVVSCLETTQKSLFSLKSY